MSTSGEEAYTSFKHKFAFECPASGVPCKYRIFGSLAYSAYELIEQRTSDMQAARAKGIRGWLRRVSHRPEPAIKKYIDPVLVSQVAYFDGEWSLSEAHDFAKRSKEALDTCLEVICNDPGRCVVEGALETAILLEQS
jgi:hypothetical protein